MRNSVSGDKQFGFLSVRDSPQRAKKRLRLTLSAFFFAVSIPVYLLLRQAYLQLETDTLFRYRLAGEDLATNMNQRLQEIMGGEEKRPFKEYSFRYLSTSSLFSKGSLSFSPLSELPPRVAVPGIIGYFQIDPDGSLHSPVLPVLPEIELNRAIGFGMSPEELSRRKAHLQLLRVDLLKGGVVIRGHELHLEEKSVATSPAQNDSVAQIPHLQKKLNQQISELNLDAQQWTKQSASNTSQGQTMQQELYAPRSARKEVVDVPSPESQVSDLQGQGAAVPEDTDYQVPQGNKKRWREQSRSDSFSSSTNKDPSRNVGLRSEPRIISFEGEIEPFQVALLGNDKILCTRKVWSSSQRFVQGFLVDAGAFVDQVIVPLFSRAQVSEGINLIVGYGGEVFRRFDSTKYPPDKDQEILLYRTSFAPPFDKVEMLLTAGKLPAAPGIGVINASAVILPLVLVLGLYGIYRLSLGQIELARERSDFVAAVSHELKTPLTSIRMYSEMLREGWVKDEQKKRSYYDYIFYESERLSRLIANVLQLARLNTKNAPFELSAYNPADLLERVRPKLLVQVESRGFQLEVEQHPDAQDSPTGDVSVMADEDAFTQIIINLVDNAVKFGASADRKAVVFALQVNASPPQEVVFSVRDFGSGIAPAQMKKIFQLFYRGENELTRTTPGTGIGLALVKELAMRMHAKVDVRNMNPGAEFQIRFLPLR